MRLIALISPVKVLNNMIHSKSLKVFFRRLFDGLSSKISHFFGICKACRSKIAYKSFENTKNENVLTTSHRKVAQESFQGLRMYHIVQNLDGTDQGYQSIAPTPDGIRHVEATNNDNEECRHNY